MQSSTKRKLIAIQTKLFVNGVKLSVLKGKIYVCCFMMVALKSISKALSAKPKEG